MFFSPVFINAFVDVIVRVSKIYSSDCILLLKNNETRSAVDPQFALLKLISLNFLFVSSCNFHISGHLGCKKVLNVILPTENYEHFVSISREETFWKSQWLIFVDPSKLSLFTEATLAINSQVVFASIINQNEIVLNEMYRSFQEAPLVVHKIDVWKNGIFEKKTAADIPFFFKRFDFQGKLFRAGTVEVPPYTIYDENTPTMSGERIKVNGFMPDIWRELEKILNFSTEYYNSVDLTTGAEDNSSTGWNGLIGMLLRNEIDCITSELTIITERSVVIDFSTPTYRTKYQVYFRQPGYNISWTSVFNPFAFSLWMMILLWIFILALFYIIVEKFSPTKETDFLKYPYLSLFFALQTLCQQGYHKVPRALSFRGVLITSYLASSVIIPSYSASLISFLTLQTPYRPFDSLEEMTQQSTYNLLVPKSTAEYTSFSKATDPLYKRVYQQLILPSEKNNNYTFGKYIDAIHILCAHPYTALYASKTLIDLRLSKMQEQCEIIKFNMPLNSVFSGFGFRKNYPYTKIINYHLSKMYHTGIIDRWRRQHWPIQTDGTSKNFNSVQINQVFQVFAFLFFCCFLSLVLLFCEIVAKKNGKKAFFVN